MATINGNLSGGDLTGNIINVTNAGSHVLTIDGIGAAINQFSNIALGSNPTIAVVNGAALTMDLGLLDLSALSSLTFDISDTSRISVDASTISLLSGLLSNYNLNYAGLEDGLFTYDPSALSVLSGTTFEVSGMEAGDQIQIAGRNNLDFSYDAATQTGTLTSSGGLLGILGQHVTFNITGMTQAQADLISADLADTSSDVWINRDYFTFPFCLAGGTWVRTPGGDKRIETLRPGDLVCCQGRAPQAIRHILRSDYVLPDEADDRHRPIRIAQGALGAGLPSAQMYVSPQHRVLLSSPIIARMYGVSEILVAAKKLIEFAGVACDRDAKSV